jgi:hypothetical protein
LSFLVDTFNFKEHLKKQEDSARRKEVKEEEAGNGQAQTVLTLGLD